jgi:hypothetical protein
MLTPLENHQLSPGSSKKVLFSCSCGNHKLIKWSYFVSHPNATCGKCFIHRLSGDIKEKKFGKLTIKPGESFKRTNEKVLWVCDCGKEKSILLSSVLKGLSRSCSSCNKVPIRNGDTINGFKYVDQDIETHEKSSKKYKFQCKCGQILNISLNKIHSQKTCGKCNIKSPEWFETRKFGRLSLRNPIEVSISSNVKLEWLCDCGNTKSIRVSHVVSGKTNSCGNCRDAVSRWWIENKEALKNDPYEIGPIKNLEPIVNSVKPFKAECPVCHNTYRPRISDIKRGLSLTCGCTSHKISMPIREIADSIRSMGYEVIEEYKIQNRSYDLFIPSKDLLIEYSGLYWHSRPNSRSRDLKKYRLARENHKQILNIYEDEFIQKKEIIMDIIRHKLGASKFTRLRSKDVRITRVDSNQVKAIYEKYHYLGPIKCKYNYAIQYNDQVIGSISFRKPTRPNKNHEYELSRMVMDPEFLVFGIWHKALKCFIDDVDPTSIVSYSDNRLFSGSIYEKLGFKYDLEIRPDYFWCKGNKRYHKSALRKPKGATETESQIRSKEGYCKIWDLGKIRWVWSKNREEVVNVQV